jgi:hypothetical protein
MNQICDLAPIFIVAGALIRLGVWGENKVILEETPNTVYRNVLFKDYMLFDSYSYDEILKRNGVADEVAVKRSAMSLFPTKIKVVPDWRTKDKL